MNKKRRKTLMCNQCEARALKWAPACAACGQFDSLIEVSVTEFEKRYTAGSPGELPAAAQAAVEQLAEAWRLPRRNLESAVRSLVSPAPKGRGLTEKQMQRVAEVAIAAHEREAKMNPIAYMVSVGQRAADGEPVGETAAPGNGGGGLSDWGPLATGVDVKLPQRLAAVLPRAREASPRTEADSPEIILRKPDSDCPICHGKGSVELDTPEGVPAYYHFRNTTWCKCVVPEEDVEDRTERLLRLSGMEGMLLRMRLEDLEPLPELDEALQAVDRFVRGEVSQLVLTGVTGCGKTHLTAGLAHELIEAGRPVLYMRVASYLDDMRRSYDSEVPEKFDDLLQKAMRCPVLIIDDLGAERATQWAREKMYEIIDTRYVLELAMVATSNRPAATWDDRVRSRLCDGQRALVVQVKAADYRMRRPSDGGSETEAAVGAGRAGP